MELLKAMDDVRLGLYTYMDNNRNSPMTYVVMANLTKDGFRRGNLFKTPEGIFKTADETKATFPLLQTARFMQVT